MKISMIFIDALRGDRSVFKNNTIEESYLEKYIKEMGGIYYTNAYTVAPDTVRSVGTMISGLYPKKNGNYQIGGSTEIFFNKNLETIFTYLMKKNFEIYLVSQPIAFAGQDLGDLKNIKCYYDYREAQKDFKNSSSINKLIFYYIYEYHELIGSGASYSEEKKYRDKIGKMVETLLGKEEYDKIILFSDHGITLTEDNVKSYYSLEDFKTNIVLWLKEEKKQELMIEKKLVSLLDIFPTILTWFNEEKSYHLDGVSLYSKKERILYMEDGHTNYDGFFLDEIDLLKYYTIGIKSNKLFKKYYIPELLILEKEFPEKWNEVVKNTVYAELFNKIYKNKLFRKNWKKQDILKKIYNNQEIFDKNFEQKYYIDFSEEFKKPNLKKDRIAKLKRRIKRKLKKILKKLD